MKNLSNLASVIVKVKAFDKIIDVPNLHNLEHIINYHLNIIIDIIVHTCVLETLEYMVSSILEIELLPMYHLKIQSISCIMFHLLCTLVGGGECKMRTNA